MNIWVVSSLVLLLFGYVGVVACLVNAMNYFCKVCILCCIWPMKSLIGKLSGLLMIRQRFRKYPEEVSAPLDTPEFHVFWEYMP